MFSGKKLIILLALILLVATSITVLFLTMLSKKSTSRHGGNYPLPTVSQTEHPTQGTEKMSLLQKTTIGQTTDRQIRGSYQVLSEKTLQNGNISYSLISDLIPRPNTIITSGGVAVFERILTPADSSSLGYVTFSSLAQSFGNPGQTKQGSNFYGWFVEHRIYASRGFAAIGNPNTDEVYEVHVFNPMASEEYVQKYGEDINPSLGPHEEGP